jgi:dihydroorotate dehydrogenase electron transfer subunit
LSVYRIANNQLRTTPIVKVKTESSTVKSFTFEDKLCAKAEPGQFLMLWIPGVDEIPLSILNVAKDGTVFIAVKEAGEATQTLHEMKAGEIIGVRGPFGNSFTAKKGKILMVGGGTGIAPLLFLARKTISTTKPIFVIGAKTEEELLFLDDLKMLCGNENVVPATEDGSCGFSGLCTEPLQQLMAKERFDAVCTCGPELMVRKVFDFAEKQGLNLEASLERLMRCAIGLCGSCVVGGYRVCKDGPVFTSKQLREIKEEFGFSKRDFDGRKIGLG